MTLPTPATVVEQYLAAIHEVLCDIRTALVGGGPVQPGGGVSHLDGRFTPSIPSAGEPAPAEPSSGLEVDPSDPFQGLVTTSDRSPTKRTRARTPR